MFSHLPRAAQLMSGSTQIAPRSVGAKAHSTGQGQIKGQARWPAAQECQSIKSMEHDWSKLLRFPHTHLHMVMNWSLYHQNRLLLHVS